MKSYLKTFPGYLLFVLGPFISFSQEQRSFNQNASRSNHTRLSFTISPVYSTSANSKSDSLLFRGEGAGLRVGADYFFGNVGIGFNSGFLSSGADEGAINNFLKQPGLPAGQPDISKARQQNMYFLLGPTVRVGEKIQFYAHAKGGIFINNSGMVSIRQRGADRISYRNEPTDKNMFAGLLSGIGLQYNTKSELWSFGIGADYLRTKSQVNNYDIRRGGGTEGLKLTQDISDVVTGITIRYNILRSRDASSGMASGKRMSTVGNSIEGLSPRDASSGLSTGRRLYGPGQPHYGNISVVQEGPSCGPVTKKITHADGSSEEMSFSCAADAAAFERQTPKRDFGDKISAPAASWAGYGNGHTDEARGIIVGRLRWANESTLGIETNKTAQSTQANAQRGKQTPQSSFGSIVRLSARDAGSGIATGKRSRDAGSGMATGKRSRDAGSGMATGRRQHQPFYSDGSQDNCTNCPITVNASQATVNPLYNDNGHTGENPMYKGNERLAAGDDDCDGVENADVFLVDALSGFVLAKTRTEPCGDFFFSNLPPGNYLVRVSHILPVKKTYDIRVASKTALLGEIIENNHPEIQLEMSTATADGQKIKTKSNIKNDRMAGPGSTNGDDVAEGQKIKTKSNIKNDRMAGPGNTIGDDVAEGQKIKTKSNIKNDRIAAGSGNQYEMDGSSVRLLKLSTVDQTNTSPTKSPGDPIPGLDVKLGKNGGGLVTAETNANGEFEFDELETGDYTLEINQQTRLFNETEVVVVSQTKAQDHNSSRSNKTASSIANDVNIEQANQTRGQDHNSSRSNKTASSIASELNVDQGNQTRAQDHNSSRSNKTSSSIAPDPGSGNGKASPESLKSISITADMDGDGVYETNVSNKLSDELIIDKEGNTVNPQQKAGISTSRSNIRTRGKLIDKGDDIYMSYSTAMIDEKNVAVQIIYKYSHDMVKGAIQNLK
jgi:hypothetical protein